MCVRKHLISSGKPRSANQYLMNTKNIRIKDIAQLAGVSVGTVDRVLHSRGRVSDDALKKVLAVLDQIDYKPNLIARTLDLQDCCADSKPGSGSILGLFKVWH
jgi:hypothetical protein